jgi:uncharacterized protein
MERRTMLKRLVLALTGLVLTCLGLVGLMLPFLPGVFFLALALLCFAGASPTVNRRFTAHPRVKRWRAQWHARARLPQLDRARLTFWLALSIALEPWRRRS